MRPQAAQRRHLPGSPFNTLQPTQVIEQFDVEDRVNHDRYGLGRVVAADDAAVIVDFGCHTVRVVSPYRKMTKL